MRIRSIRPEFWTSEDIAAHDWETRLIFIGLWSYVDDNGVGRDVEKLITADLFPLEDDPHGVLMQVARALKSLDARGQICRYEVDGKPFLHICAWADNQVISRPSKGRYPLLTCEDARSTPNTHVNDMSPHANDIPGEGEKGRRGEGEKNNTCASADAEREFETWYLAYPRKRAKGQAAKAYRTARKKTDAQTLLTAVTSQAPLLMAKGVDFAPYPASWLNGERWLDEVGTAAPDLDNPWDRFEIPPAPAEIADDPMRYQEWLREKRAEWDAKRAGGAR